MQAVIKEQHLSSLSKLLDSFRDLFKNFFDLTDLLVYCQGELSLIKMLLVLMGNRDESHYFISGDAKVGTLVPSPVHLSYFSLLR